MARALAAPPEPDPDDGPLSAAAPAPWRVVLGTALAYAAAGLAALLLASTPGSASPLFPPAGIALAAMLCYGRAAGPGVVLGALIVNLASGAMRGQTGATTVAIGVLLACGSALQAGLGAALVRRFVDQPLVLTAPRDIVRFGVLGGPVACGVNASLATAALLASGNLAGSQALALWTTWWAGDVLGVLITAPLVLTLIAHPRADWRSRRRTVGIPLLVTLALVAGALAELGRLDRQRLLAAFERDADRLAAAADARLAVPLFALQALHGAALAQQPLSASSVALTARWWLDQHPTQLLAMGYSERVALPDLPAFEARARQEGLEGYRVFDRDGGQARARDGEVLAIRLVAPVEGNTAALGVNTLSVPAARAAVMASKASAQPAATAGFALTQSQRDETGLVVYQALYHGDARDAAARQAKFRGVVFVAVPIERALEGMAAGEQPYLSWCLLDADPAAQRQRLAGRPGCEGEAAAGGLVVHRKLVLAGRELSLRMVAQANLVPGRQRETFWLLSVLGMAAVAMLGALLLTVTGHSRRTELAVQAATGELRREIAERTQAESALRESEARLRSILDHVPLGVMFLGPTGELLACNPRLAELLARDAASLRGLSVGDLIHAGDLDRLRQLRHELLAGADKVVMEPVRLLRGDGAELLARASASALRSPDGRTVRIVGVVEDITEHLRLLSSERALQRAEAANRAKSEFLSRMSHELRTPLNAMIGFAQLLGLDRNPALAEHQAEWNEEIQRAGWHLLEMINETLDLARIESGAVQLSLVPVPLSPLVAACVAMLAAPARQRGVRVETSFDDDAAAVLGDATRVKQVLTNLLSNAVKYNVQEGRVQLSARRLAGDDAGWIEIAVADTGMGMTPEQQAALFQPYNRLGRENSGIEGTGIGLVISRRLAELMGGSLHATSTAGEGSVFTLRLPAAQAVAAPPPRYSETSPAPYRQRLVHYVEDNETNIEIMRGVLAQRAQVQLRTSQLGLDGLAAIRDTRPDLVLLDMQLPDISGLELLRHIKRDDSICDIPVVVVSADATVQQTQQALTSGAAHYVTKPLDIPQFLQIVDRLLEAADTRWA